MSISLFGVVSMLVLAWQVTAVPQSSEKFKAQACLAAMYEAQASFRQKHGDYATDSAQLYSEPNTARLTESYCRDLAVTLTMPNKDDFRVSVEVGSVRGSVSPNPFG